MYSSLSSPGLRELHKQALGHTTPKSVLGAILLKLSQGPLLPGLNIASSKSQASERVLVLHREDTTREISSTG